MSRLYCIREDFDYLNTSVMPLACGHLIWHLGHPVWHFTGPDQPAKIKQVIEV